MSRRPWTEMEDMILRAKYSIAATDELCRILKRTPRSVYARAPLFGLKRDRSWLIEAGKKLSQNPAAVATRFAKGSVPANKGKKMRPEIYDKLAPTMFKSGHMPINHRPVGSERVNVDGYVEIKVAEPRKWKLKHRVVWEEQNGPIPRGYNIQFRDGNPLNVQLDNLYIISRADQLKNQNSIQARYPEELRGVIRVKATLKGQITRYNKKHHE